MRFRTIAAACAALVLLAVGIPVGINAVQDDGADRRAAQQEARGDLRSAGGGRPNRVSDHRRTGLVRFVGTEHGRPITTKQDTPVAAAREFLAEFGVAFGAHNSKQLRLDRAEAINARRTMNAGSVVRFQQDIADVPVVAGEIAVRLDDDNNVIAAFGELLPVESFDTTTSIDAADAADIARAVVAKRARVNRAGLEATTPQLWIYSPALIGAPDGRNALVWRTSVGSADPITDVQVLVDARTGNIALYVDELRQARDRRVCNNNNNPNPPTFECTSPVRTETSPPTGVADVDRAHDYTGDAYDFFFEHHDRDSIDDRGMPIRSMVKYCDLFVGCPMLNAFWFADQLTFGEGFVADDVVAHELTHGVIERTADLFYAYQSGAINESLADVWGEFVDLTNGSGSDAAGDRWLLGEDVDPAGTEFDGAIRDMKDPPAFGDPDRMRSSLFHDTDDDNGGVHVNSGVNNKAVSLLTDGGTFNGQTIAALGIDKVADIYYEALTGALTSGSDYADLSDALRQACETLIGTGGISASTCADVTKAVTATEMDLQPLSGGAPEAPLCDKGDMSTIFFDNIESGSTGWSPSPTSAWNRDGSFAHSGDLSWLTTTNATATAVTLSMTSSKAIPAGSDAYLRFDHGYFFERFDGVNFDGGVVQYSINGGSTWTGIDALPAVNGYNGEIADGTENPLSGSRAFVGHSRGYTSTRVDLSALAGKEVRFRFRYGTDEVFNDLGWALDDVRIYSCVVPPQPTLSINDVTVTEGDSGTSAATFVVTKSGTTSQTVTVDYATANGTGPSPATAGSDFVAKAGTLTFSPTETSKTIDVTVNGDTAVEPNETLNVGLSAPTNATISKAAGIGTIVNDDVAREITVNDVTVEEGAVASFTIEATHPEKGAVIFDIATADGSATSGDDYTAVPSTEVTIPGGETSVAVDVPTTDDDFAELVQEFELRLSDPSANGLFVDDVALGTIIDDDSRVVVLDGPPSIAEGGTASYTISANNSDLGPVDVVASTIDGTATHPDDYAGLASEAITIPAGGGEPTEVTFEIETVQDAIDEPDHTFTVKLALADPAPAYALIGNSQIGTTIADDDLPPVFRKVSINNKSVTEGNTAAFTITATEPGRGDVTLHVSTVLGTAEAADIDPVSEDITIPSASTSYPIKVSTNEDSDRSNETFKVVLSDVSDNAELVDAEGLGTIIDDDTSDDDDADDDDDAGGDEEEDEPTPTPTPTGVEGAKLSFSPVMLVAGKSATVTGTGFPADTLIDLYIFSEPMLLGSVRTTASGTFALEVDIPLLAAGQHTLVALRASDDSPVAATPATLTQVTATQTEAPGTTPAPTARVLAAQATPEPAVALPNTGANIRDMVVFALAAIMLGAGATGWARRRRRRA